MWYAAHVIMAFRYREGKQGAIPVWENVFLVQASSPSEAQEVATAIGREEAGHDDPSTTWDGIPVRLTFAGVRKVVECSPPPDPAAGELGTGTEVTYTEFLVDSETALEQLVAGEAVTVTLQDEFDDDASPPI